MKLMLTTLIGALALSTAATAGDGYSNWPQNDARYAAETGQDRNSHPTQSSGWNSVQATKATVASERNRSLAFIRAQERLKNRELYQ